MSPYASDKIIINNGNLLSFWSIIKGLFKGIRRAMDGSEFIAQEIEEHGWLTEPEALEFLKEQEEDCAKIDAACSEFIKAQIDFHSRQADRTDRMRRWFDSKLAQRNQQP
jgi:hypothetical protein